MSYRYLRLLLPARYGIKARGRAPVRGVYLCTKSNFRTVDESGFIPLSFYLGRWRALLSSKEQSLLSALEPLAASHGVEIVTIEIVGPKKAPTIRIYIDTDHGVSFDELAGAQSWINDTLDAIDPFPGAYTLEVSSPGIDRPLRTAEHFERFAGETASVQTLAPHEGRSRFTGEIVGLRGETLRLMVDGVEVEIPLEGIKSARLKGRVDFSS